MKRFAIGLIAVLLIAGSASAMDLTGMFQLGVFGGYGMGFGEAFDDYDMTVMSQTVSVESSLQFNFGANMGYNFTPDMGILGIVTYQMWKFESSGTVQGQSFDESETESWISVAANFAYYLMPEEPTKPYFFAGPAVYIPSMDGADTKIGVNGGIGVVHFFNENVALNARARFEMIPSAYATGTSGDEKAITAGSANVGISYFYGGTGE